MYNLLDIAIKLWYHCRKYNMLKKLWNTIVAHQEARAKQIMKFHSSYKALSQLSAMSDKELRDIGIKRGDIPHVAFGNMSNG